MAWRLVILRGRGQESELRAHTKNIRIYGKAPYDIAVVHGGPGAPGQIAPVARELSLDWGVLEPLQTEKSLEGQIQCPVVAIHGDFDSHPAEGVEKPLSAVLKSFRLIRLKNCGHMPWIERQAKDQFYKILKEELQS